MVVSRVSSATLRLVRLTGSICKFAMRSEKEVKWCCREDGVDFFDFLALKAFCILFDLVPGGPRDMGAMIAIGKSLSAGGRKIVRGAVSLSISWAMARRRAERGGRRRQSRSRVARFKDPRFTPRWVLWSISRRDEAGVVGRSSLIKPVVDYGAVKSTHSDIDSPNAQSLALLYFALQLKCLPNLLQDFPNRP